jgi:hypothetical protein
MEIEGFIMDRDLHGKWLNTHRDSHGITCCKTAMLLLVIFCVSAATIAWTSPSVPTNSQLKPASLNTSAPVESMVKVSAWSANNLDYCQALKIVMNVTNFSGMPANNVHLFCRAAPGGYFIVTVVDRAFTAYDINNIDISLGDLPPGRQEDVIMFIQAPPPGQILGEWSHNFDYNFAIAHDLTPESLEGTIILTARHGKILVQKNGFDQ